MQPRSLFVFGVSSVALGLSGVPALAQTNVALPANNPNVRAAGTTTFGNVAAMMNNLNDGANPDTQDGAIYQVPTNPAPPPPPGSRGFGYDLGGLATVESLDLSQYTATPIGVRSRLANVNVHTYAGVLPLSLPDQDDVTITFPSPVATSYVMIEPVTQHPGNDPQIGIDELAVNSAAGTVTPRTNLALGRPVTLQGPGFNNVNGNLTDNVLAGGQDVSTGIFNDSPTNPDTSIDVDLGSPQTVGGFGLGEHDFGGAGGRTLAENVTLEFSDDAGFGTVLATRSLTLANIPYQQVEFAPVTAQFVRLSVLSVYPNPDTNLGFTEVQYFTPIPEPAALGLLAFGALPLLARRRRAK